jgi:hypothetical protein
VNEHTTTNQTPDRAHRDTAIDLIVAVTIPLLFMAAIAFAFGGALVTVGFVSAAAGSVIAAVAAAVHSKHQAQALAAEVAMMERTITLVHRRTEDDMRWAQLDARS